MSELAARAREIADLCVAAGLTHEEMAERAAIKWESMRKIVNGYQPCSDQLLQSFRNIAEMERLRRSGYAGDPPEVRAVAVMVREIAASGDGKAMDTVKNVVTTYHIQTRGRKRRKGATSSDDLADAADLLKAADVLTPDPDPPSNGPKPVAPGTSVSAGRQSAGVSRETSAARGLPKSAQKQR